MGILGLWKKINDIGIQPMSKIPKFDVVYIDANIMFMRISIPLLKLHKDSLINVFNRNYSVKMNWLDMIAKKIVFVFDAPGVSSLKTRRPKKSIAEVIPGWLYEHFKQLIIADNYPIIMKKDTEADTLIAKKLKGKNNDAVFTEDSDLLMYSKYIIRYNNDVYHVPDIITGLGMSRAKFIAACNIAGNDYNDSTITFSKAMKIVLNK